MTLPLQAARKVQYDGRQIETLGVRPNLPSRASDQTHQGPEAENDVEVTANAQSPTPALLARLKSGLAQQERSSASRFEGSTGNLAWYHVVWQDSAPSPKPDVQT
ncbi:hypothetical protein G7Y79_00046g082130 [Physcia stellaris]|nr:hypothetical protein G7Y79_00046g082130 [Physcia stellaris]